MRSVCRRGFSACDSRVVTSYMVAKDTRTVYGYHGYDVPRDIHHHNRECCHDDDDHLPSCDWLDTSCDHVRCGLHHCSNALPWRRLLR